MTRHTVSGPLSMIALREIPEPDLPTDRWVRIRPVLSGVCGSDLATICAKGSPYFSPLTSTPFVLGHELVGKITRVGQSVTSFAIGDRVVIQPALGCTARGIDSPCQPCREGELALCSNVTKGDIAAGIQTGFCRDTGGAWSECLVAHQSQVYKVPDAIEDQVAVLAEPFACCCHAVCRASSAGDSILGPRSTVLVIGCGTIGLLVIAALRALEFKCKVIAAAKHDHQRSHALRLGANEVLMHDRNVGRRYAQLAKALGAELHHPEIGKPTVIGGADVTFDCVASSSSINDACRFTKAGGYMTLVGMPAIPKGIDWTGIWYKQLTLLASYAYGVETHQGKRCTTFELTLEMLRKCASDLRPLVGAAFDLRDYKKAIQSALHTGPSAGVKTVFRIA